MYQDKWLTIEELADYLKMGRTKLYRMAQKADIPASNRTKLYRMAQKADIPASKIGNQWRFDREEIDEWMKSQRPAPASRNSKGVSQ
jgi:excisionase family DNA binding protein